MAHFANKEVGDMDSWAGKLDDVPFHIYSMKEPDYVILLMSTNGMNFRHSRKETQHDWKEGGVLMTKTFKYPEVVHNHFQNCHSVDDHNAKRHSPISIEVVWVTKQWPNHVFAFLFVITEVNCILSESHFTSRKHDSMMDYRKELSNALIENWYLVQEELAEKIHKNPARNQSWVGVAPTVLKIFWRENGQVYVTIPPPPPQSVPTTAARFTLIASALQESIGALTACCSILKSAITILKDAK